MENKMKLCSLILITVLQINKIWTYKIGRDDSMMQSDPHSWLQQSGARAYKTVPKGCGGKAADVYFVLDTSNDVTEEEFQRQKQFLTHLTPLFYMKRDTARIGVLSFGNNVMTASRLGSKKNFKDLKESIKSAPQVGGRRDTAQVLRYLRTKAFSAGIARQSVAHVVILLTSGHSQTPKMTRLEANLLKKTGTYVYTVAFGGNVDKRETEEISTRPASEFVFASDDFSIVDSLSNIMHIHHCNFQIDPTMQPQSNQPVCTPTRPVDIVFPVDHIAIGSVNTEKILNVIQLFLKDIDPTFVETAVLFSRTHFVSAVNHNQLESLKDAHDRLKSVEFTDLGKLLRRTRRVLAKGRKGIQKTVVLFIDESVPLSYPVFIEAKRNKFLKIETYVVYVGTNYNKNDLELLSNGRGSNHIIQVNDYDELSSIQEKILLTICKGL